jgi:phage baseplate assembly protein W
MPYQIVNINDINQQQSNQGIGIQFPFNVKGGLISSTYTTKEQLISNFKILLLTYKGERFYHNNFGTDLMAILFEPNTSHLKVQISETISEATSYWLPQVNIIDIETTTSEDDSSLNCQVKVKITFQAVISQNDANLDTISIFVNNNTLTIG